MTDTTLSIPGRYNGPPDSANGGYCCGALASHLDCGQERAATVRLASPPPLDSALIVHRHADASLELQNDQRGEVTPVATAIATTLEIDVPKPPTLHEAQEAARSYIGYETHSLPGCYVCGPDRQEGDGMRLFPGPVGDSTVYACIWSATADQVNPETNEVRPEFIWAALDCPGYFSLYGRDPKPALLGELTAELKEPVVGGADYVVFAWPISRAGRKLVAGTAIADASGSVLAVASATWIELKT